MAYDKDNDETIHQFDQSPSNLIASIRRYNGGPPKLHLQRQLKNRVVPAGRLQYDELMWLADIANQDIENYFT